MGSSLAVSFRVEVSYLQKQCEEFPGRARFSFFFLSTEETEHCEVA